MEEDFFILFVFDSNYFTAISAGLTCQVEEEDPSHPNKIRQRKWQLAALGALDQAAHPPDGSQDNPRPLVQRSFLLDLEDKKKEVRPSR